MVTAANQTNTGLIQANAVYLGGNLVNGITDYFVATPAPRLPDAVINLGQQNLPNGAVFTPGGATLFASASRLALLVPGPDLLNSLLPPELRAGATPYLFDGWLEQQALRAAALNETGRVRFLAGLDSEEGQSPEARQRQLLYAAAAARFALSEGIKLGVALSPEQQARLQEPILWYVQEQVTGPDGAPVTARVPHLYLPEVSRAGLTVWAGGSIEGERVTLAADHIRNTGVIAAQDLGIEADTLRNEKRSASIGEIRQYGADGYWRLTGDTVQPGGFIRAARLQLNVRRIDSVSGEFWAGGREISPELGQRLGEAYTYRANQDHIRSEWVSLKKRSGLEQVAVMAVAIGVSVLTYGAASEALFWSMAESSLSATVSMATLDTPATAVEAYACRARVGTDAIVLTMPVPVVCP